MSFGGWVGGSSPTSTSLMPSPQEPGASLKEPVSSWEQVIKEVSEGPCPRELSGQGSMWGSRILRCWSWIPLG